MEFSIIEGTRGRRFWRGDAFGAAKNKALAVIEFYDLRFATGAIS